MMVGDANPEKTIHAKNAEERAVLRKLLDEPLVARVDVDWGKEGHSSVQTIYFPRRWTGGLGVPDAQFVSSYAALGQLAEYEAGETANIDVNGQARTGRIRSAYCSPRNARKASGTHSLAILALCLGAMSCACLAIILYRRHRRNCP